MRTALILTTGFIGDILFASSVAEHLIEENQYDAVDYLVGFPQPIPLLKRNPYIRNVYLADELGPDVKPPRTTMTWDMTFKQPIHSFTIPPAMETQIACGVQRPSADFTIYTDPDLDEKACQEFSKQPNRKRIAWVSSWELKSYVLTPETYAAGVNHPEFGYGTKHRNTSMIVGKLCERYNMCEVGYPVSKNQYDLALGNFTTFEYEASCIKQCDYFIGCEGGLANLAYGVGTKTILTSDFVLQLYGWNGSVKKVQSPMLGPTFYGKPGHVDLDPFLTDDEVVEKITEIVG